MRPAIFGLLLAKYFDWYFVDRPKKILKIWKNFIVFGERFFSIFFLLKTLFAPFHGLTESYGRGFDLQRWLFAGFSNLIFRVIGAMVRLVIIGLGLAFEALVLISGFLIFIGWFLFPILVFLGLFFSLRLILA